MTMTRTLKVDVQITLPIVSDIDNIIMEREIEEATRQYARESAAIAFARGDLLAR